MKFVAAILLLLSSQILTANEQNSTEQSIETGEQIIRQMESKQVYKSSSLEGRIVINDRFGEKVSTFLSWSLGLEHSLIEFTSIEEIGQKVLRTDDDIYIFYPDAEELVRLSGSALRDGMLGSDVSYEDMTGETSLLDDYEVTASSEETLNDTAVYKIDIKAKKPSVAYQKQSLWIDKTNLIGMQSYKYSLSGTLLKVETVLKTEKQGAYEFPVHIKVEDKLKSNSSTQFYIDNIEVDTPLTLDSFSLDELTW